MHDESQFVESSGGAAPEEDEELTVDQNKRLFIDEVASASKQYFYDKIQGIYCNTCENNIIVDKLHTSVPIVQNMSEQKFWDNAQSS